MINKYFNISILFRREERLRLRMHDWKPVHISSSSVYHCTDSMSFSSFFRKKSE